VGGVGAYSRIHNWCDDQEEADMKIGVPATGPLGDRFEVWTIREPNDPQTTIKWTICIFDRNDRLVLMDVISHTVGVDYDIKRHVEIIDHLSSGIYRVNVYYGDYLASGCENAPADELKYMFYIHRNTSSVVSFGLDGSWYPDRQYIFTLYVADGKLFYQSSSNRVVPIPAGADVFVEVTGSDNNAYVGIVNASSDMRVVPNASIPFVATLTFKFDKPVAWLAAKAYGDVVGFARGITVDVVDDYTLKLIIAKSEVGLGPLGAALAILALIAIIVWGVAAIVQFIVELTKVDQIKKLSDERDAVVQKYINEADSCGADQNCLSRVQAKYLPIIQGYDAAIGALSSTLGTGACNGLKLSGVCVPWWVVAVAIFLAGLLVISAVK
jgi:hypothetical protein